VSGEPAALSRVVALSGGVGGARFLDGVARALPPGALTAVVNTGDDFEHLGLTICPDLDTVMYTLAGLADEERGWGLAGETFSAMGMTRRLGGPDWFSLGDRDLGTHLVRSEALRAGTPLGEVTARLCRALGVGARVLPMADGPCRTLIDTVDAGTLPFQEWFVQRRAQPAVRAVRFDGRPPPAPGVLAAIADCELVLIGPSNPYVSIDPILSLDGVRAALGQKTVVAVSPIVGGRAVKGPLATMIPELTGAAATAGAIARHYGGLLAGLVVERGDEQDVDGVRVCATDTIMRSRDERVRLARETLAFAAELAG
jgi:LPPG:FO 2-phospho-L-lactate transferase